MAKKNRRNKLLFKQILKYFLIIVSFLTFFMIYRLLGNIDRKFQICIVVFGLVIILVSIVLDLASAKDIIPIFKG